MMSCTADASIDMLTYLYTIVIDTLTWQDVDRERIQTRTVQGINRWHE